MNRSSRPISFLVRSNPRPACYSNVGGRRADADHAWALAGIGVGWYAMYVIDLAAKGGWMAETYEGLAVLGLGM